MDLGEDEDAVDLTATSFQEIGKKMKEVTSDGKIKKKIVREGVGQTPPENAMVSILYCSYLEYQDEPTDCAFIRKPYTFRLGTSSKQCYFKRCYTGFMCLCLLLSVNHLCKVTIHL